MHSRGTSNYKKTGQYFERSPLIKSSKPVRSKTPNARRDPILDSITSRPAQVIYHDSMGDKETFFNSTKRDSYRYLERIRNELGSTYQNLEII
jgi:hypothetical protein